MVSSTEKMLVCHVWKLAGWWRFNIRQRLSPTYLPLPMARLSKISPEDCTKWHFSIWKRIWKNCSWPAMNQNQAVVSCAALTPLPGMLDKWDGTGSLAARTSVFSGRQKIEKSRDGSLHQGITACLDVQVYLDRLSVMLVPSYMDYGYTN